MAEINKPRNSNLELLRIIAIIFIIAHHLAVHGFGNSHLVSSNINTYFIYFFSIFGEIGVDIFILISAYFMINSEVKFKKILILGGEVYFYSLVFLALFLTILTPVKHVNNEYIIMSLLPFSHLLYWFMTDYILLMLLSPFLNQFIKKISRDNLIKLIIFSLIIWSIYPSITGFSFDFNNIIWFIILYLIGSFIRLNLNIKKIKSNHLILLFIFSILLVFSLLSISLSMKTLNHNPLFQLQTSMFTRENNIFILTASLSLFLIFLKRKEFSNKFINYIAGSVLGVYLIHDNIFIRSYLWKTLLHVKSHYYSTKFILFAILSVILIFIVCTGIDIIRRVTIEKIWIKIIDKSMPSLTNYAKNKFNSFKTKLNIYLNN